jgi:hypothetical protein
MNVKGIFIISGAGSCAASIIQKVLWVFYIKAIVFNKTLLKNSIINLEKSPLPSCDLYEHLGEILPYASS